MDDMATRRKGLQMDEVVQAMEVKRRPGDMRGRRAGHRQCERVTGTGPHLDRLTAALASKPLLAPTMTTPPGCAAPTPLVNHDPSQDQYGDLAEWFLAKMPEYMTVKGAFLKLVADMLREMDTKFPGSGPDGRSTREDRQFRKQVCRLKLPIQVYAHTNAKALHTRLNAVEASSASLTFP
jgi:hypothetical protein